MWPCLYTLETLALQWFIIMVYQRSPLATPSNVHVPNTRYTCLYTLETLALQLFIIMVYQRSPLATPSNVHIPNTRYTYYPLIEIKLQLHYKLVYMCICGSRARKVFYVLRPIFSFTVTFGFRHMTSSFIFNSMVS